jgi:hypothetical protein
MQLESLSAQGLMQAFFMTSQTFPPRQEHAKAVALEALVSGIPPAPHLWHVLTILSQINPVAHLHSRSVRVEVTPVTLGHLWQAKFGAMILRAGHLHVIVAVAPERLALKTMPMARHLQSLKLAGVVTYGPLQKKQAAEAPVPTAI